MIRVALCVALLVGTAGCASHSSPPQANKGYSLPPPRQASVAPAPARAFTGEPGEAVWHLRAGLNVAALSCRGRGRTPVAGSYGRLLSRHRGLLANAYAGEQRRYGKGMDRHLTQVYNRFANQRDPARFCSSAASVAQRAAGMDSPTLATNARSLLGEIN